jgi:general secretion pathway protein G
MIRHRVQAIRSNDNGFTLIELLIVVMILGVLAGITVFAVGKFNDDGVLAACKTDKKSVEVAAEAYYAKSAAPHTYPADAHALYTAGYLKDDPSVNFAINDITGVVTGGVTGC